MGHSLTSCGMALVQTNISRRKVAPLANYNGKFHAEPRPVCGKPYFPRADNGVQAAVVICLYNEEAADLSRTIDSLKCGPSLDIVIVADGLEKLSCSAREYLLKVFGLDPAVLEDATYDQTDDHGD